MFRFLAYWAAVWVVYLIGMAYWAQASFNDRYSWWGKLFTQLAENLPYAFTFNGVLLCGVIAFFVARAAK